MPPWLVPELWPGSTIICIGSGPSLTQADVDACRGRARVIAINNAYQRAPWADVLYACGVYANDPHHSWWDYHPEARQLPALKITMDERAATRYGLHYVRRAPDPEGVTGLSLDRTTLRHGYNSGYQALNLAVLLGARCIILLGYDMQPGPAFQHHWHPDHPRQTRPPYTDWLLAFGTLVAPLRELGVAVVNCTRTTALSVFPRQSLEKTLCVHP